MICRPTAYSLGFFVVMNKGKWNALPADVKKTIEKINVEWAKKQGKAWDTIDKIGTKFALEKGGKLIKIAPKEAEKWGKTVEPVAGMYVKDTKAKGLPGNEVLKYVRKRLEDAQKGTFKSKYMFGER
jgi:TRAP-type C4-dicarboxylate transport system substrate-binding protein